MSYNTFADLFKSLNIAYSMREGAGSVSFILERYVIPNGRYAGRSIDIAIEVPRDFPDTPPYGIHVKSGHGFSPTAHVNPSSLGGEWEHWSRQMEWGVPGSRTARYCLDQINRWLEME